MCPSSQESPNLGNSLSIADVALSFFGSLNIFQARSDLHPIFRFTSSRVHHAITSIAKHKLFLSRPTHLQTAMSSRIDRRCADQLDRSTGTRTRRRRRAECIGRRASKKSGSQTRPAAARSRRKRQPRSGARASRRRGGAWGVPAADEADLEPV